MKTVLEFLEEQKQMSSHNLLCYSANYFMDSGAILSGIKMYFPIRLKC